MDSMFSREKSRFLGFNGFDLVIGENDQELSFIFLVSSQLLLTL
jgi:hypothetical protein